MRPDFSLIWGADNAPFTAIEASDYTAGWVFRTGAPPRRVNFDYFQNLSDQRAAWLGEQMLLAVGHEWQDDVTYDAYAVVRSPVNGQIYRSLAGGNLNNEPSVSGAQWALGVSRSDDFLDTTRIDVASASTVNLTTAAPDTRHINITGTTTINAFTVESGKCYFVRFNAALTLTSGASLVTQSGANILTAAGDTCIIRATAANVVEVLCYSKATVQSLASSGYKALEGGLIMQWGVTGGAGTYTFPIAFPTAFLSIAIACLANDTSGVTGTPSVTAFSYVGASGSRYIAFGY